jgi:alpha-beta hydrolase superfamily lysophospholipase
MKMLIHWRLLWLVPVLALLALAACITLGGPVQPPTLGSINDPFKAVDFSGLPPVRTYLASDGQPLAYRDYAPSGLVRGSVTLVHGSSASSNSMHVVAKALAQAGYRVLALDLRGHGQSGVKGHIDHIGQLDSDLANFVRQVHPPQPSTLVGFSAGGGFALRFAGSANQALFGSYLLLSPYLDPAAPNQRPNAGGWAVAGVPRIVGLNVLNALGVHAFNGLPVLSFALSDRARAYLTPQYDFNLAMNFRPERDYVANIKGVKRPCAILAGDADEVFKTDQLAGVVRAAGQTWPVELLPGIGHINLILAPAATAATVRLVGRLQQ